MAEALQGIRVLEWCDTTAGAFCGKLLADLGAEVIKVEAPGGDPSRRVGPFPPGLVSDETSGRFLYLNTGKRSVALDTGSADGRGRMRDLVLQADVVIDDESTGLLAGVIGTPAVPLVWCSITPFGLTGPYRDYRAHHLNIAHAGGEGHLLPGGEGWTMFPDRPPVQIGSEMAAFDAGANAAVAVLGACYGRLLGGPGHRIDVSAQESQVALFRTRLVRFTHDGVVLRQRANPYTSAGGMFHCRDGFVQILGTRDESWRDLGGVSGGERFREARYLTLEGRTTFIAELNSLLAEWCGERTKAEVVTALGPIGFAVGAYAVPADLLRSPQLAARGFFQTVEHPVAGSITLPGVPYKFSATPVRLRPSPTLGDGGSFPRRAIAAAEVTDPTRAPLAGVRILDFTWAIAGPYTTMLLAMLGAEVIKVETAQRLDVMRRGISGIDYGGINKAPDFNTLNLNKRSLGVDLSQPAGIELVRRLFPLCDVVVDNFRPGVMKRFGFGADALLAEFPSMIVASSSGNGADGPEALYAGLASIFAAMGGVSEQTGYPDGPPTLIGESPDYRSGNLFALAIIAALIHRARTGLGQSIDLSSREVMTILAPDAFLAHTLGATPIGRLGNRHPVMAPHSVYPCAGADEWVSVAVATDDEWRALCSVLGRDEWTGVYPDASTRKAAEETIDSAIAAWTRQRSAYDAFATLQAAGVASAPSFTNADLVEDPHLGARGVFVDVEHPDLGKQRVPGAPWFLSGWDCPVWRHGPLLGQDNDYVLGELLGLPADERARFAPVLE